MVPGVVGLALGGAARRGLAIAPRSTRGDRWQGFGALCGVALAGTALHVAMDLPTLYGTRLLSPFVDTWYALDWLPIIDVYIWALLVMGLLAAWRRPAARKTVARVVLAATVAFYGVRAVSHEVALSAAAITRADGTHSACASAPTLSRHPTLIEAAFAGPGRCLQAAALPTFFSPFDWRLVRQQSDGYELRDVRLGRGPARIFVPSQHDAWIARARQTPTGRAFFNFSRFPAATSAALLAARIASGRWTCASWAHRHAASSPTRRRAHRL